MSLILDLSEPLPYFEASFKGIPFKVETIKDDENRRIATGAFPYSDTIATQDLGRMPRKYTFTGKFSGLGHRFKALLLKKAFESYGAGYLSHPSLGILYVSCIDSQFSNDLENSYNITRYTVNFIEANDPNKSIVDGVKQVVIGDILNG